jgi:hypothetical protein
MLAARGTMTRRFAFGTACNRIRDSPDHGSSARHVLWFGSEMSQHHDIACSFAHFAIKAVCCGRWQDFIK